MAISEEELLHVADLIKIDPNEAMKYSKDLNEVLSWFDKINEAVLVLDNDVQEFSIMRDDVSHAQDRERVVRNAPVTECDCFVVPKVIDQGE